jgi:hypothetical protein
MTQRITRCFMLCITSLFGTAYSAEVASQARALSLQMAAVEKQAQRINDAHRAATTALREYISWHLHTPADYERLYTAFTAGGTQPGAGTDTFFAVLATDPHTQTAQLTIHISGSPDELSSKDKVPLQPTGKRMPLVGLDQSYATVYRPLEPGKLIECTMTVPLQKVFDALKAQQHTVQNAVAQK